MTTTTTAPSGFTLYHILRDHSLAQLDQRDSERLRDYQNLLAMKIEERQALLLKPNLLSSERREAGEDISWFQNISHGISTLLTAEFHQKVA